MINQFSNLIGNFEKRLIRLEKNIGNITDEIVSFVSINEDISVSDTVYIYSRDVNDSFLIGTHKVGVDEIGDRRSQPVLLYSG